MNRLLRRCVEVDRMMSKVNHWRKGMISILLVLSLTACQRETTVVRHHPDKVHQQVDYADMVYTGFDETTLQAAFTELEGLHDSGALQEGDARTRERVAEL